MAFVVSAEGTVAKINDAEFATLTESVATAENGGVITLCQACQYAHLISQGTLQPFL